MATDCGLKHRAARRLLLLATVTAFAAACEREPAPVDDGPSPISFETGTVRVETSDDTLRLRVEIAERDAQRAYGLMERSSLPDGAGMIFLHQQEQPSTSGFWMFRTRIPLDIAYLDADGGIVSIRAMEPCLSLEPRLCPTYPAEAPYRAALEVNRGWFARNGVRIGDRVVLERD